MKDPDEAMVRSAVIDNLHVHPRLVQQGMAPTPKQRKALLKSLPQLIPFTGNTFVGARALLDWDHQLPSQHRLLRLYMCYGESEIQLLDAGIKRRDREIREGNLYPEFDLPDFSNLPASETYIAVMKASQPVIEDLRFTSDWRRRVEQSAQQSALATVSRLESFNRSLQDRTHDHLGPPVVIGWTPPCLAHSPSWAVEVWLLIDFDGHRGRAHVFMIDSTNEQVTREFFTEVLLG
ncbi:MAG TPA: hypothetical protein ENJ18_05590 [Nannocystis exedens]|nr:hypothetical protein [Nannocystis exedens]